MASANNSTPSLPEPLSGKFKESFAYVTIKDRLPVILTKVIDLLYRDRYLISEIGEDAEDENKQVIGRLAQLRNEMMTNKPITPLVGNLPDVSLWNNYLKEQVDLYGFVPCWFDSPWLYVECYLYRRIKESFELSSLMKHYDPFQQQKQEAFLSSISTTAMLATTLNKTTDEISLNGNTPLYEYFVKFVEMSLWGNKCDLSISVGKENQTASSLTQLKDIRHKIICNDTEMLWNILQSANHKHNGTVRLDFVLDNAGFELFTDLCLVEFLDTAQLVNSVHFYVKCMPWFVSDTLTSDLNWLLNKLVKQNDKSLAKLGEKWTDKITKGKWTIEEETFWTLPHDYSEMRANDSSLYNRLSKSHLIIFKGDLNYRKLTSDRNWDSVTSFAMSLRGFSPAPLCALRTIKADVITGLKSGEKEALDQTVSNWLISGDYAVIQCANLES